MHSLLNRHNSSGGNAVFFFHFEAGETEAEEVTYTNETTQLGKAVASTLLSTVSV